jgi:hypothetical protein
MAGNYIPANDLQFRQWFQNFVTVLTANEAAFDLVPADVTPLSAASTDFGTKLEDHVAKRNAAATATATKNTSRDAAESVIRPMARRINNHPAMTDALRVQLGLRAPESGGGLATAGNEDPGIYLESGIGVVIVHFGTDPQNEMHNGKPAWVKGCNIYRKANGDANFRLIAFETASPYVDTIIGAGADYSYYVQYRGTKASDTGRSSAATTIAAGGQIAA